MLQSADFFKVNLAGQGYTLVWPEGDPGVRLEPRALDGMLPVLDAQAAVPIVAYSASLLDAHRAILIVGSHWAEHKDEFGRAGLSFWHGIIVRDEIPLDAPELTRWLLPLVQRERAGHRTLGEIVRHLAAHRTSDAWWTQLTMAHETQAGAWSGTAGSLAAWFQAQRAHIPRRCNVRASFPIDEDVAIPCLLDLLVTRGGAGRVAGGALAREALTNVQHISTRTDRAGFEVYSLRGLPTWSAVADPTRTQQSGSRDEHGEKGISATTTQPPVRPGRTRGPWRAAWRRAKYSALLLVVGITLGGIGARMLAVPEAAKPTARSDDSQRDNAIQMARMLAVELDEATKLLTSLGGLRAPAQRILDDHPPIEVEYYRSPVDRGGGEAALQRLGVTVRSESSKYENDSLSYVRFGARVPRGQVERVACALIEASYEIKSVAPFSKLAAKPTTIEIGPEPGYRKQRAMTCEDVQRTLRDRPAR